MSNGMLALFPLHTVLVPGFPLALHIFEDRYRRMVSECLRDNQPFGVCLIREGEEVGAPAVPFDVGTVAMISEVETLPDDRYNLLVMGGERFRVDEMLPPAPHPCGRVTMLPDEAGTRLEPDTLAAYTSMAEEYVHFLTGSDATVHLIDVPAESAQLSWFLTFLLQVSGREKQALLEENAPDARLERLAYLYARELSVMRQVDKSFSHHTVRPLDTGRSERRVSPN